MSDLRSPLKVTLIGLGLMGGSLAAALQRAGGWELTGMDRSEPVRQKAVRDGFVARVVDTLQAAVTDADMIIFATPVSAILEDLSRIGPWLKPGAVVCDLGSTKKAINDAMESLPASVAAIGGHPMAGKRTSSVSRADADLYTDRKFILVPNARTTPEADALGRRLVADIGADLVVMEPDHHDHVVAMVSHLPHFLAFPVLFATEELGDPLVWQLAAGTYQQVTQPAADNPVMWRDVAMTNGQPIADVLRGVAAGIEQLAQDFEAGDADHIESLVDRAKDLRDLYFPPVSVAATPGLAGMARTYSALGSEGSWSHAAAAGRYPNAARIGFPTFEAVAAACAAGEVDLAVFPIHNTSTGTIPGVDEIVEAHGLRRVGDTVISILHCLVCPPGAAGYTPNPDEPISIYSHEQGFLQCKRYLSEHYGGASLIEESDTASGVRKVAGLTSPNELAIGSAFAAELYGAHILHPAINDAPDNETRFIFCVRAEDV